MNNEHYNTLHEFERNGSRLNMIKENEISYPSGKKVDIIEYSEVGYITTETYLALRPLTL